MNNQNQQIDIELFLKRLRSAVLEGSIEWLKHSLQRMMERDITRYIPDEKYFEKDLITRRIK